MIIASYQLPNNQRTSLSLSKESKPPDMPALTNSIPARTRVPTTSISLNVQDWKAVWKQTHITHRVEEPEEWQKETVVGLAWGECRFALAPTGSGKSLTWGLMLNAIKLNGGNKFILVVAVTKAMQDDQVSLSSPAVSW